MIRDSKFEIRDSGNDAVGAVLVCGAGIAGIQASLDLAGSGFKVYLLDSMASIGGRMAQLDKTFPTDDCAMCILSPKLVECARNKNIEIIALADIQSVSGEPGSFKVKIRQNPRYIDIKKCDACGDCAEVCPVNLPNEFDGKLSARKAIFKPYPQSIPNAFTISKASGPTPCKAGCPAGVNVQGATALIAAGKFTEAYELIRQRCPLPASCGRVCRHHCQSSCNRKSIDEAVSFSNLERFVGDHIQANPELYPPFAPSAYFSGSKVAVIGGGPAGLTAAADLALVGYGVTLFDAKPQLGGMLRYGIPGYRLPKDVLDREIQSVINLGVEVRTNASIAGPKDLLKSDGPTAGEFSAVFVATGAWEGRKLGIPGEEAQGVQSAVDFLCGVNSGNAPRIGRNVLVIGGSDLALDAARCALRLPGVESVHLACLESQAEMPAQTEHVAQALREGVVFHHGLGPTRIEVRGESVSSVIFRACTSVFDNYRGFRRYNPLFDDSQVSALHADTVITAVGRSVDSMRLGMETRPGGRILADNETLATSIKGIFAGGDAVLGPASVANAIAQGHKAAESIDAYIRGAAKIRNTDAAQVSSGDASRSRPAQFAPNPRPDAPRQDPIRMPQADVSGQLLDKNEINLGYSPEQSMLEAQRCLSCGLCSECMQCVKACSAGAIVHDQQPAEIEMEVGSIILTPGMQEFQASLWEELGYGRCSNVLTAIQFERMLSVIGSAGNGLKRPSDGREVKKIAFIQCVGSRDPLRGMSYCSSVCCMSAAKGAIAASEYAQGKPLDISIFCTDVRTSGKECDGYVTRARDEFAVKYVRARPYGVAELPDDSTLRISYPNQAGEICLDEFDLVILSAGMRVSPGVMDMAKRLGLDTNSNGFAQTNRFSPSATSKPGIYVAGSFQEPKDIPESAAQGSAAAAYAMEQLTAVRGTMVQHHEYPWERDVADEPPRIGVFVCHCGHNISSVIDVDRIAAQAARLPGVYHAEASVYTCSDANQQHIKAMIRKHRLNRLVVASCSSRTHEALFQETLRESGLNQYLFAMTNIRDQCSWVHRDDPAAANTKAMDLVSMAVARARRLKQLPLYELPVTASALVLGGGLAGMTAALSIAGQGFKVHLVEREASLGGLLRNIRTTLEHADVQKYLKSLIEEIQSNRKITVYLNSGLVRTAGQVGNFTSTLNVSGKEMSIEHGVVIVATGGGERATERFLHGRNPKVLTQSRLESLLAGDSVLPEHGDKQDPTIVMIQCVESRDEKNPYCSRVCCAEAVKNALEIKRRLPLSKITIIGRDIRTFGFREAFYQEALKAGVLFVRCEENHGPVLIENDGRLEIKVHDILTGRDYELNPDLLVLSTGISPAAGNSDLSRILRSALTGEGFFLEAHPKLRPVDLANEGEFLCGLAHSPRFMDETIVQAQAAAARASTILSRAQLEIIGQIAQVNPADCVACATCVKLCPYGAPTINALKKAEIQSAKCMGCGSCASACPARAIMLQHQEGETMTAMLDELLVSGGSL